MALVFRLKRIELRIRVNVADFGLAGLPFRAPVITNSSAVSTVCIYKFPEIICLWLNFLEFAVHRSSRLCDDILYNCMWISVLQFFSPLHLTFYDWSSEDFQLRTAAVKE